MKVLAAVLATVLTAVHAGCGPSAPQLEQDNAVRPNAPPPFGMEEFFGGGGQMPVPARVRLGRWLFFDTRLSADNSISCATCHRPDYAFSEPSPVATGINGQRGRRRTPSIVNLAARTTNMAAPAPDIGPVFFWDGRATSLEQQVLAPIADPKEMGMQHPALINKLSAIAGYRPYFLEAFGSETPTAANVASALADYVRSRVSGNAPYDQWAYRKNGGAMSDQAQLGLDVFSFKGRCGGCHAGFNFSDGLFHNLGVGWNAQTQSFADEGRAAVSHDQRDAGKFKTPALREVARHPPYMHDGSLATLRDVVEFYNRGGIKNPRQTMRIAPLGLTENEIDAVVEFLKTLNGEGYEDRAPRYFPK